MPINVGEIETQVDVQAPAAGPDAARTQAPPEALMRFEELVRRGTQLAERTAAWGFDD
jgi:hypothetical protein